MNRFSCTLAAVAASLLWIHGAAQAARQVEALPGEEVTSELIVHLKAGIPFSAVAATFPAADQELAKWVGTRLKDRSVLSLTPQQRARLIPILLRHPQVELIEPNRVRRVEISSPNDPSFASQWNLVGAAAAWKHIPGRYLTSSTSGSLRIKVAVLDTGTDCAHPDFTNAGGSSTDAAAGGQLNWALSRTYLATTVASPACAWQDDHGHGTHVAGIVGAATNNSTGVSSLGYPLQVITMKVLNSAGSTNDVLLANAIVDAVNAGADIVSMSLGGATYSQILQDACNYAWANNALVVAAAGNRGNNLAVYPAGNNHSIGVIAHDSVNVRATFSSFGSHADLAAPGVSIFSTTPTYATRYSPSYASLSGTSMATPHVAALAGLMMLASPGASADVITQRLQQSAASALGGGGWGDQLGYGRIDVEKALTGEGWRTAATGGVSGQVMDAAGLDLVGATVTLSGTSVTTVDGGQFRFANVAPGDYTLTVAAAGFTTLSLPVTVVAGADTPTHIRMGVVYGTFQGTITSGGAPLEGAIVHAMGSGQAVGVAVTNAAGVYRLAVPAGTYDLRASAFFRNVAVSSGRSVSAGATTSVPTMILTPMGRLEGFARDGSSNPVSGADVLLTRSGPLTRGATTDGSGYYRTLPAPAGSYTAEASKTGLPASPSTNVSVVNETTGRLDFSLSAASMTVLPGSATLGPSGTQQFSASLGGSPTTSVAWSLIGPGSISTSGLYTAPASFSGSQSATVRATLNGNESVFATASVTISNIVSLSLGASSATGGNAVTGNLVTISQPAPASGATVTLGSNNGAATPPATVVIPSGQVSVGFTINTSAVASATPVNISASYAGASANAGLTIQPAAVSLTVSLGGVTFAAGNTFTTGVVNLGSPAPGGGLTVTLGSSNGSVLSPPSSVFVSGGGTQATFSFSTGHPGSSTAVTVTATAGASSAQANATVTPLQVQSLTLGGSSILGGSSQGGNAVTLTGNAPAGGIAVTLGSNNGSALQVPALSVPGGAKTANFTFTTSPVGAAAAVVVSANLGGATATANFTVNPPVVSSVSPGGSSVTGGSPLNNNTLTISGPAPAGGLSVAMSSSSGAASVPNPVTVPAGATSVQFSITTSAVGSNTPVTITASFNGSSATGNFTVLAPGLGSVNLGGATFGAGNSFTTGTVTLANPAPSGGINVTLSAAPGFINLPSSINISAGATQGTFSFSTGHPSSSTAVTVSASTPSGTVSANVTVTPLEVTSLALSGSGVTGGQSQSGNTVTLSGTAPSGGTSVTLSSNNGAAQVTSPLVVPGGANSASFVINTSAVGAVTPVVITATLGSSNRTANFSVNPPGLSSLTLSSNSVLGGNAVNNNSVTLSNPAGGGATVQLTSSNPSVASVPSTVVVGSGATSAQFNISTAAVAGSTPVTITATFNGVSLQQTLTVNPPGLSSVSLAAGSIIGGNSLGGNTVNLSQAAPSGGINVGLTSSNPSVLSVPASVAVGGGATSAGFAVNTSLVGAATTVTVTASFNGVSVQANIQVNPVLVTGVTLSAGSITGGNTLSGNTVTLNAPAPPSGVTVNLGSSNSGAASPQATVNVPGGASSASFAINTSAVASNTGVNITATLGSSSASAGLTVLAPASTVQVSSLTLAINSGAGGVTRKQNTVRLTQAAPAGGAVVTLSSSNPAVLPVPASVTIPAGLLEARFVLVPSAVTVNTAVTITASFGGASAQAVYTVTTSQLNLFQLLVNPVTGGTATTGRLSLTGVAPAGGVSISLSSASGVASVQASVTVPAGQSFVDFPINTTPVGAQTQVVITANQSGTIRQATVTINP